MTTYCFPSLPQNVAGVAWALASILAEVRHETDRFKFFGSFDKAKRLLNNKLYKTGESRYVLGSEELPQSDEDIAFTGRTLLVAGDEHFERVSGAPFRSREGIGIGQRRDQPFVEANWDVARDDSQRSG
jgi:hypothetical protein